MHSSSTFSNIPCARGCPSNGPRRGTTADGTDFAPLYPLQQRAAIFIGLLTRARKRAAKKIWAPSPEFLDDTHALEAKDAAVRHGRSTPIEEMQPLAADRSRGSNQWLARTENS